MDNNNVSAELTDTVFNCLIAYITDPNDRNSVSLVCRKWYELDGVTRKHVTVPNCYSITPSRLRKRFPHIESLIVKGQPHALFFKQVSKCWGGYVTPWVEEIVSSFTSLKEVCFKRMIVRDSDMEILAKKRGTQIRVLKFSMCSGFSTDGLLFIGKYCTSLRTLCLEMSLIDEKDGEWLHELALRNKALESLSYFMTNLVNYINCDDLVLLAKNCCATLVSLKVRECSFKCLVDIFRYVARLEDFGGVVNIDEDVRDVVVTNFPPKMIRCITLGNGTKRHIIGIRTFAHQLTKLNLMLSGFDEYGFCGVVFKCPNLEELYISDAIGDLGLKYVGQICKKLRMIKIERVDVDGDTFVSDIGLVDLAKGCPELEYLHVNVKDITNETLECIGAHLKKLIDFSLILEHNEEPVSDLPLDNGICALLKGCTKLEKLGIHLRAGGLTDVGLGYIGKYGQNVRYMFLGLCGKSDLGRLSDAGLKELSKWCQKLQKLEMNGCAFSRKALATFMLNVTSVRYLWVEACPVSECSDTDDILAMARPFWNMELIRDESGDADALEGSIQQKPPSLLAYYSLVGQRKDMPDSVTPIYPHVDFE